MSADKKSRKYVCPRCPGIVSFDTDRELRGHLGGKHGRIIALSQIEHGTVQGYKKEVRRKMRTCRPCRNAWSAYIRNRRTTTSIGAGPATTPTSRRRTASTRPSPTWAGARHLEELT